MRRSDFPLSTSSPASPSKAFSQTKVGGMVRTLLIAVDSSHSSVHAFDYAMRHIYREGDKILLLTVQRFYTSFSMPASLALCGGGGLFEPNDLTKANSNKEESQQGDRDVHQIYTSRMNAQNVHPPSGHLSTSHTFRRSTSSTLNGVVITQLS